MSKTMESTHAAIRIYGYFEGKGWDGDQLSIVDGSTFTLSVEIGEATLAASFFYDFLSQH